MANETSSILLILILLTWIVTSARFQAFLTVIRGTNLIENPTPSNLHSVAPKGMLGITP